jgi:hypothetical protein
MGTATKQSLLGSIFSIFGHGRKPEASEDPRFNINSTLGHGYKPQASAQAPFNIRNDNNAPQIPAHAAVQNNLINNVYIVNNNNLAQPQAQAAAEPILQPAAVSAKKPYLEDAPAQNETKALINCDISSLEENAQELKTLLEQIEGQDLTEQIPEEFRCVFTMEPMIQPVKAADGGVYEYKFITTFMNHQREKNLPIRGKFGTEFSNTDLEPLPDLQKELIALCKKLLAPKENKEEESESPGMSKK